MKRLKVHIVKVCRFLLEITNLARTINDDFPYDRNWRSGQSDLSFAQGPNPDWESSTPTLYISTAEI
jgi:hypothetical protein